MISLTSFPQRINTVWLTIETLLNQKNVQPAKIELWLADEQFPDKRIPKSLLKQMKRGLEIKYCSDLKPHKKYYYSFLENRKKIVITVDDDILYPSDFVEKLYNGSKEYPNTVICNWSHKITFDNKGNINKYDLWDPFTNELSMLTVPIGCCGVLYKPSFFDQELYDIRKIKDISLYTDDLWLKWMEIKNNIGEMGIAITPKKQDKHRCHSRLIHRVFWKTGRGVRGRSWNSCQVHHG